jgi:uncharacterized damage-inducible protein DinB
MLPPQTRVRVKANAQRRFACLTGRAVRLSGVQWPLLSTPRRSRMPAHRRWFDRQFELGLPPEAIPEIIERLRGAPARLEERFRDALPQVLIERYEGKWSIQENAGHLLDLEPLWAGRLDDLLACARELRSTDLQNRKTDEANHNSRHYEGILAAFRNARKQIVLRLEGLDDSQLALTALHPRLRQPMTAVDLFFFVAEHDDHHLARITRILKASMLTRT